LNFGATYLNFGAELGIYSLFRMVLGGWVVSHVLCAWGTNQSGEEERTRWSSELSSEWSAEPNCTKLIFLLVGPPVGPPPGPLSGPFSAAAY